MQRNWAVVDMKQDCEAIYSFQKPQCDTSAGTTERV
jgi:hypothetical protein